MARSSRPYTAALTALSLSCGDAGGRYWVRTSDLLGVNEALYH